MYLLMPYSSIEAESRHFIVPKNQFSSLTKEVFIQIHSNYIDSERKKTFLQNLPIGSSFFKFF